MIQTIDFTVGKYSQGKINMLIRILNKECEVKDIRTTFHKEYYHNQILIDCDTPITYDYDFMKIIIYYTDTKLVMAEFTF